MSVKVENICKEYGKQLALDKVTYSIDSGEIVGLVGPNGAGKSTMMKIITCFLPQTSGTASVCGYNVITDSIEIRKKVGYLPENNPLYLDMYVGEYLEFVAGIHKLGKNAKSRIEEMIEITGLQVERRKRIGALSKGYRQRVGLAQALIHDPEVLILDEPTSGLDPNQIVEIRNVIKKVGEKKTVLFSTHIMQEVEAICNRVIIIDKGRIVADRPTSELQSINNTDTFVHVEFDKEVNKNVLRNIPGVLHVADKGNKNYLLSANKEMDIRPEIFKFAVKHELTVLSMNIEEKSLEETFQHLTNPNS